MILGIDNLISNLTRIAEEERSKKGPDALTKIAGQILDVAQDRTSVRSGALKGSGIVHPVVITDRESSVTISFGDDTVGYAISVHENLAAKHLNGQAKFLETAVLERSETFQEDMAVEMEIK